MGIKALAIVLAVLAVLVGAIYGLVDRAQITPEEGLEALERSEFPDDLPAGLELTRAMEPIAPPRSVLFFKHMEVSGASGQPVTVSYTFMESSTEAAEKFAEAEEGLPELLKTKLHPGGQRTLFEEIPAPSLPVDSNCLKQYTGQESCEFVVGPVMVWVESSLPEFVPGEKTYVHELSLAAYEHISQLLHL